MASAFFEKLVHGVVNVSDKKFIADCRRHLRAAYFEALRSSDASTQNGALLVDGFTGETFARGFNEIPEGVERTPERMNKRPDKYFYYEHAERSVILRAAREGFSTHNATMYVVWAACADCARAIIGAGIRRVVTHYNPLACTRYGINVEDSAWMPSIQAGINMLTEAGVQLHYFDDGSPMFTDLEGILVRFNGKAVSP